MEKNLRTVLLSLLGGLIGFVFGYVVVLFTLLMIFGSLVENASIVFLTMIVGILYGLALGNLYSYYPKYVNKFCIIFCFIGILASAIGAIFLKNIRAVLIIGVPILFALLGIFIDKRK